MEYSVSQLATAADLGIDTLRFYQAKGLLPAPRRRGRRAVYSAAHLEVLRQIRRYQSQGYSLAVIKRLLASEESGSRKDAPTAAVAAESGEQTLDRAGLAARTGVPEALLASLEAAGLLVPVVVDGDARYGEADLRMARAGLDVLGQGFPLPELMQLAVQHAQHVGEIADGAVDLFDRFVRKVDGGGGAAPDAAQVADDFRRLLPAVTTLVALHFQRTLLQRALARLRSAPHGEALEQAMAVIESGRLEVTWR